MKRKTRCRVGLAAGFGNRSALDYLYDRQPATGVVVMPVRMMAAIGAKHCTRLIPESAGIVNINADDAD